ncbi:MAG: flagellar motor stator protein MotA [Verrucomicrobia bacterium]|jgi:chemotaxis protein MotA|nr:flagellar motor stator protein MotA [Verrucomicrobiota bacterium]MBT5477460.1 flagellar motor stator protein MotA [Verrucomicrobiota bacterium]MBT6238680.1 flagellar motor stator protein MotA [Verrucomicrobiota bacterium]MBT6804187.1 flagellar motor stator protein MotA [Verrucomicrobiota bacterium]
MFVIIGAITVFVCVIVGFVWAAHWEWGILIALTHWNEYLVIIGAAVGSMIIMAPRNVLMDLIKGVIGVLKGIPYSQNSYEDLFQALYELFMIGRKNGMIALEDHVNEPASSSIFSKYPSLTADKEAMTFISEALRPIIDGRIKAEELKPLLDIQLRKMDEEGHEPISVLTKVGDALPGFGIVAAVLGIVVTMGAIAGPVEEIGEKVGSALVGTFLGIFLAYGFVNPLATNMTFVHESRVAFLKCVSAGVVSFCTGAAPAMAIEISRRGVASSFRPDADELEQTLKSIKVA